MKKLLIATSLLVTFAVQAEPTMTLKAGGWPGPDYDEETSGLTHGLIVAFESSTCGRHCISPNFVHLTTQHGKNAGLGIDYIYKLAKRKTDTFALSFGLAAFDRKLNFGEHANFHVGAAFEIFASENTGFVISYDHYSNANGLLDRVNVETNVAVHLLSIGFHFK